jgi:diacylglycerol kinase
MKMKSFSSGSRSESFRFAFSGLASLLKNEYNARIHLIAAAVAVIAGIILKIDLTEWCLLVIVIGLVFLTELLNTSLEALGDAVDREWNERIKKAKDYSAGAVLISAILSLIIGGIIFLPKIIGLLQDCKF